MLRVRGTCRLPSSRATLVTSKPYPGPIGFAAATCKRLFTMIRAPHCSTASRRSQRGGYMDSTVLLSRILQSNMYPRSLPRAIHSVTPLDIGAYPREIDRLQRPDSRKNEYCPVGHPPRQHRRCSGRSLRVRRRASCKVLRKEHTRRNVQHTIDEYRLGCAGGSATVATLTECNGHRRHQQ